MEFLKVGAKGSFSLMCVTVSSLIFSVGYAWPEDVRPKMVVQMGEKDVLTFDGNLTNPDHFKLIAPYGDTLLIGGRNFIFNISVMDFNENQRIEWHAPKELNKMCFVKGKNEEECQNYIRVLIRLDNDRVFTCGTNSYKPLCRIYAMKAGEHVVVEEMPGTGIAPFDPYHNSTTLMLDGEVYSATAADRSGNDPLIYRKPTRTEQYDLKHFNAPNFVSSVAYSEFVFFFFRETAVEYINCGKAVYSRVARVCKNDRGGHHQFRDHWTSFLKARLNCSLPGEFPFHFNEIQSATEVVHGTYGGERHDLIYAVFTTPPNSIPGSAVCAFAMRDILNTFEGPFKEQGSSNLNWLPVHPSRVPEPRPGRCSNQSTTLPDTTLTFVKSHSLMDESVPAFFGSPIVMRTNFRNTRYRMTKIAVDHQVKSNDGKYYDILFIGTNAGKVIRAINSAAADSVRNVTPVIIEEIQVFGPTTTITNLEVVRSSHSDEGKLVVLSSDQVRAIPLQRCYKEKIRTCRDCVSLQDPYCAWNTQNKACEPVSWSFSGNLIQNISSGQSPHCPEGTIYSSTAQHSTHLDNRRHHDVIFNINPDSDGEVSEVQLAEARIGDYTIETLAIAVASGSILALLVGFMAGYCFGKRCPKTEYDAGPCVDAEYEFVEQIPAANVNMHMTNINQMGNALHRTHLANTLNRYGMPPDGTTMMDQNIYMTPHAHLNMNPNKPIDVVLNMSPKNGTSQSFHSTTDRGHRGSVRKMYL